MADDILSRLRCSYEKDEWPCEQCTFCAARAEIERLRAENALLQAVNVQMNSDLEHINKPATRNYGDALDAIVLSLKHQNQKKGNP